MSKLSTWHKFIIVLCVLIIATCTVAIGILGYDVRSSYQESNGYYDHATAGIVKNLYYLVLLLSAFLYAFSSRTIGKANIKARRFCYATSLFFVILMIVAYIGVKTYPRIELLPYPEERLFLSYLGAFLPSVLVYSILISFLSKKTNETFNDYYLIPLWMIKTYHLKTNLRKRLFMVFIIYPLFALTIIPVFGLGVIMFYSAILLILLLLTWICSITMWIIEGRKIDKQNS